MNDQARVTLVLPSQIWDQVKQLVPSGQRSQWVAETLESELRRLQRLEQAEALVRFHAAMQAKYGVLPSAADEIDAVRKERQDELADLP